MLDNCVRVDGLRHIAKAATAVLDDAEILLQERERILEMFGQALMEHQVKSIVRERGLESVATNQVQILETFTLAERIDNFQAVVGKIEHIDIGAQTSKFGTVAAGTSTDLKHLQALELKILLNSFYNRRRRRIDLVHVVLALPKTVPYGLIGLFNRHNGDNI